MTQSFTFTILKNGHFDSQFYSPALETNLTLLKDALSSSV